MNSKPYQKNNILDALTNEFFLLIQIFQLFLEKSSRKESNRFLNRNYFSYNIYTGGK